MTPLLVIAAFAGLAVILLFWGLAQGLSASRSLVETRLDQYAGHQEEARQQADAELQRIALPLMAGLNKVIARRSFAERIATDLARADLKITVAEYLFFIGASVILGVAVGFFLFRDALAILGGVVGFFLPSLFVRQRQGQRLRTFNNQLGDAITLLANSLRSGYSLLQSMETISKELSPPMSDEFHRVVREIGLGLSNDQALDNLLRRINSDDLDLMVTAIKIQHEVGGNLAEILDNIGHTIRERVRIQGEIRVLTSMQRMSGYVITALPVFMGTFLFIVNRPYMQILFTDPCGLSMLLTAVVGVIAGFLIIRRVVAIEV